MFVVLSPYWFRPFRSLFRNHLSISHFSTQFSTRQAHTTEPKHHTPSTGANEPNENVRLMQHHFIQIAIAIVHSHPARNRRWVGDSIVSTGSGKKPTVGGSFWERRDACFPFKLCLKAHAKCSTQCLPLFHIGHVRPRMGTRSQGGCEEKLETEVSHPNAR